MRLPGSLRVTAGQVRYQVNLIMRTPRALLAGLIFPGALLAPQIGKVQHLDTRMSYLPAQPMVDAATRTLTATGGGLHLMTGHDLAVLAGWTLGGLLISGLFFQCAGRITRHD